MKKVITQKKVAICTAFFCFALACNLKSQNVGVFNGTSLVSNNFLFFPTGFPSPTGTAPLLRLGFNYPVRDNRLELFGGGIRNTFLKDAWGLPWSKWQEQGLFKLNIGLMGVPPYYTFNPGIRYLANSHNWAGYGAVFGLKEEITQLGNGTNNSNPENQFNNGTYIVENSGLKNPVISFSYPTGSAVSKVPRLIFEKVQKDTTNLTADVATELMTLTSSGFLGINRTNPTAQLHVTGNAKINGNLYDTGSINLYGNQFVRGTMYLRPRDTSEKAFELVGQQGQPIAYSKGPHLYFEGLKRGGGNSTDIYNVYANAKGELVTDGNPDPAAPYIYKTNGNNTLTSFNYFGFESHTDMRILNGNGFDNVGLIHGASNVHRGAFEWRNRMGIGGDPSNNIFPTPHKHTTLRLISLNNKLNFGNSTTDTLSPGVVLLCESQEKNDTSVPDSFQQKHLFSVLNTGHVFMGYDNGSSQKPYSLVTIGTPNMKCGNYGVGGCGIPIYQLGGLDESGDFKWYFKNGVSEFQLGASKLSDYLHEFQIDADIFPRTDTTYSLGKSTWRYRELHLWDKISIGTSTFTAGKNGLPGTFIWDGDILPLTTGNSFTFHNTLGASNKRWWKIYSNNALDVASDRRLKTNIENESNGLDLVMKMRPVTFDWKNSRNTEKYHGFIAQELKQLFPNSIVSGDSLKDTLTVRYSELIPVLTKAIQELNTIVKNQNSEINKLKLQALTNKSDSFKSNSEVNEMNRVPILFQNSPNPFDNHTVIDYFLPAGFSFAAITVSDQTGKLIFSHLINTTGIGQVMLNSNDLAQGVYYYSLIVNGKPVDTKQMQVVKN